MDINRHFYDCGLIMLIFCQKLMIQSRSLLSKNLNYSFNLRWWGFVFYEFVFKVQINSFGYAKFINNQKTRQPAHNQNQLISKLINIMRKVEVTIGILLVLILLGHNYTANIPQAIQDSIMKIHSSSTTQFNLLYSLETLPRILFDILGTKLLVPAALLLMMGQLLLLVYTPLHSSFSFIMMILGRVMQGISGQMLYMAMGVMTTKWMGNLSGLIIVLPQIGQILNVFFTPLFNIYGGLYLVNFIGMAVCLISFVSTIFLWRVDKKYEKMTKQEQSSQIQTIECSTYAKFPRIFWLIIVICAIDEGIFIPFLYNANTMLQVRFGISYHITGGYISIPFAATMIATGIFAVLLRKVTRNTVVLIAAIGGLISHTIIYYIPNSTESTTFGSFLIVFGFIIFGIAKGSYYAVIYPAVGQAVPKQHRGTAYALVSLVESLGITLIPEVSAWIIQQKSDKQQGYTNSSLLFMIMALLGMGLSLFLVWMKVDILTKPNSEQQQIYYEEQAQQSMTVRTDVSMERKQEIV